MKIVFLLLSAVSIAIAKPQKTLKPPALLQPAPPPRDTTLEDTDLLDSILSSKINVSEKNPELAHLSQLLLEHSPIVSQNQNLWMQATLEHKNLRYNLFPVFSFQNKLGRHHDDPMVYPPNQSDQYGNLTLNMKESLYNDDGTLKWISLEIGAKTEQKNQLQYEYARDQSLLDAMTFYFDWSQSMALQELESSKRQILRRQLAFVESQFRQGYTARRDVLRLQSEIRRSELDRLHRITDIKTNKTKLFTALGISESDFDHEQFKGEDVDTLEEPASETDKPINISDHPLQKILRLSESEKELSIRLAQTNFWPHVDLQANANYTNDQYLQAGREFNTNYTAYWEALVVVSWTIWDWGILSRKVQKARLDFETQKQSSRQQVLQVEQQVTQVLSLLRELKDEYSVNLELLNLEKQNYNALENDYRNNRASYLDLILSINAYIDARSKYLAAYYDLRRQKMTYDFHSGLLYQHLTR